MRKLPAMLCAVCAAAALALAVPLPETRPGTLQDSQAQLPPEVQERLSELLHDEQTLEQVTRDKRTIAVIRQLFPGLGQLIDRKIQQITQYLFRTIGRAVLRGGLGGGGGAAAGGDSGNSTRRVIITLPTFPPDSEEEEDEDEDTAAAATGGGGGGGGGGTEAGTESSPTELNPEENQLSGAESQVDEVRAQYTDKDGYNYDQDAAATGNNDVPDPANGDAADDEDAERNKRLINFSLGASGGAGGGSGNVLFDIIRSTADRAARAAGTIYRVVAGTENLGLASGVTATKTTSSTRTDKTSMTTKNGPRVLVSGSGNTESSSDQAVGGAVEKEDGYGAGIPGPITRLFVIANRGIANLVQDLILRIAQTSERLVNFKARLITSII